MALKFRRGTTAQKSGSLAFGEPFVNTDLNTLQIGGTSGDITLGTTGVSSTFAGVSVSASSFISGSGLKITGNAAIDGNLTIGGAITIGDNTSDVINVVASLSSSLIPSNDNVFNIGSTSYRYANVYATTVSASAYTGLGNLTTYSSSVNSRLVVVEAVSASAASALNSFSASNASTDATQTTNISTATAAAAGAFASASAYSASAAVVDIAQDVLIASLRSNVVSASVFTTFSTSVDSRLDSVELVSASAASALNSFSASNASTDATQTTNISTATAAAAGAFASASAYSASAAVVDIAQDVLIASLRTNVVSSSVFTTLSSSVNTRLVTLEGKDISVTLTGDVTGTGTITDLGNVSFATTIAADSVALGTDTTGNYVATITGGTGVSSTGATTGEGIAHTISIGQAVATSDNVRFNSLGIGMAASATAGRIDASNDIVAFSSSDIRFKENITPIENALEKISKISGNTYDWKEENKAEHGYEGNDVGVIAQEIEAVLPQLVQTRENGYKAVKYDKLVALLIEGIKEQQTQIHSLTLEIEKLKESKGL